ncbi:hypothetical protein BBOV_III010140 [Babesia bovis T2Bo]|uniref:Uncharacterized protein n=1 Tax=Babesia bovis TaxID=5865 RepID=A7APT6_BABBO|nr:hypothetical protein BBOV_III010140 [Babesia bovis T2Bo]EDO08570.1 hypothetical protein BBOV_III010140 [Babesia bovis T2Bo]|eukprot:XP_001612138.1 hypothetical protein [Babesia bovis T2Bo]
MSQDDKDSCKVFNSESNEEPEDIRNNKRKNQKRSSTTNRITKEGYIHLIEDSLNTFKLAPSPIPNKVAVHFRKHIGKINQQCSYCGAAKDEYVVPEVKFNLIGKTAALLGYKVACKTCEMISDLRHLNNSMAKDIVHSSENMKSISQHFQKVNELQHGHETALRNAISKYRGYIHSNHKMRKRLANAVHRSIKRGTESSYGRFTGTEFYMAASSPSVDNDTPCLGVARMGRKKKMTTHVPVSSIVLAHNNRINAVSMAINMQKILKNKKISPQAKEYWRHWILKEVPNLNGAMMSQLICSLVDLRMVYPDIIRVCILKLEDILASNNTTDILEAAVSILTVPRIHSIISLQDIKRCVYVVISQVHEATGEILLRLTQAYTSMLLHDLVTVHELGSLIQRTITHPDAVRVIKSNINPMVELLKASTTYIEYIGDGPGHVGDITAFIRHNILPVLFEDVYELTAEQVTDAVVFLDKANVVVDRNTLVLCSQRFVRDAPQFAITAMLQFHNAMINMGYIDPKAILTLITTLPRRTQSLDSVEHILALIRIVQTANLQSEYMNEFILEQLMQIGYKVGKKHKIAFENMKNNFVKDCINLLDL